MIGYEDARGEIEGLSVKLTTGVGDREESLGVFVCCFGVSVVGEDLVEDFLGKVEEAAIDGLVGKV